MELEKDFSFRPLPPIDTAQQVQLPPPPDPPTPVDPTLGPLGLLPGKWEGKGFNTIWRPKKPEREGGKDDFFLELNNTTETIQFSESIGEIPNRGFLQSDIVMFGVHYLQQIKDTDTNAGLHIEPGLWVSVPQTEAPPVKPTICRMASIPHGTTILAQGIVSDLTTPPVFDPVDITPFVIGHPEQKILGFRTAMNVTIPEQFRTSNLQEHGITQDMVSNPNTLLEAARKGQNITQTVHLIVSSESDKPVPGGGTSNTAFLQGRSPQEANADATVVTANLWIETVEDPNGGTFLQLQYTQNVLLNFNGLSWPHVTVATLRKVG